MRLHTVYPVTFANEICKDYCMLLRSLSPFTTTQKYFHSHGLRNDERKKLKTFISRSWECEQSHSQTKESKCTARTCETPAAGTNETRTHKHNTDALDWRSNSCMRKCMHVFRRNAPSPLLTWQELRREEVPTDPVHRFPGTITESLQTS
jgi:L-lysine 2,3-aminomutase